jgi:uncharacterized membrane protein
MCSTPPAGSACAHNAESAYRHSTIYDKNVPATLVLANSTANNNITGRKNETNVRQSMFLFYVLTSCANKNIFIPLRA